jgi:protein SCO1
MLFGKRVNVRAIALLALLAALAWPGTWANAQQGGPQVTPAPLSDVAPLDIRFDQNLGSQVPLNLAFVDETGQRVLLGQYFGTRPVILVMAYYECPMLCTLVLNGLIDSLQKVTLTPGQHFDVLVVSIDPRETYDLAADKKDLYVEAYGRPETAPGWHFLTGQEAEIAALSDAIGFRYEYEQAYDQYAHPAGLTILTPTGVVSHYFFGIEFNPADLRLALVESSENKIGNVVDQFYLLCYAYDPDTGSYGLVIQNVLRLAGTGTVLVIGGMVLLMIWRERRAGASRNEVPQ